MKNENKDAQKRFMRKIFVGALILFIILDIPICILVANVMGPIWGYIVMPIASLGAIAMAVVIFFLVRAIERRLGIWEWD